jgi:hypothetical protein
MPVPPSHSRIVLSSEAEAIFEPSGENATELTGPEWLFEGECNRLFCCPITVLFDHRMLKRAFNRLARMSQI